MLKFNYFEAELMEYRDYFEEEKEERQKFEEWLFQKRYEDILQEYHKNLSKVDHCKQMIKELKFSIEREGDFIEKYRMAEEIARYKDCLMDCEEKLSYYLEPKIKEYEDTYKQIEQEE